MPQSEFSLKAVQADCYLQLLKALSPSGWQLRSSQLTLLADGFRLDLSLKGKRKGALIAFYPHLSLTNEAIEAELHELVPPEGAFGVGAVLFYAWIDYAGPIGKDGSNALYIESITELPGVLERMITGLQLASSAMYPLGSLQAHAQSCETPGPGIVQSYNGFVRGYIVRAIARALLGDTLGASSDILIAEQSKQVAAIVRPEFKAYCAALRRRYSLTP